MIRSRNLETPSPSAKVRFMSLALWPWNCSSSRTASLSPEARKQTSIAVVSAYNSWSMYSISWWLMLDDILKIDENSLICCRLPLVCRFSMMFFVAKTNRSVFQPKVDPELSRDTARRLPQVQPWIRLALENQFWTSDAIRQGIKQSTIHNLS